jgi:hypothetical protein
MEYKLKAYFNQRLNDVVLHVEERPHSYVHLIAGNFDSGKITGDKLYFCMQKLHTILDTEGIKLLCNAFRYDVYPSKMSISMGQGTKAYKMVMGKPATELVNIFDPTEDLEAIVTYEKQVEFVKEWSNSL